MATYPVLTAAQAGKEVEKLRQIFSVVRVLSADEVCGGKKAGDAGNESCACYEIWEKPSPCENCVSAKALAGKTQKNKIEFCGDEVFFVISRYVEIDGKPHVIEMVEKFDEKFVDVASAELITSIAKSGDKAYRDSLTGALNRRYYDEMLNNGEILDGVGVAMFDIDDFKVYNDLYGHKAGDAVLVSFVNAVESCLGNDEIFVRYGGDEFLFVCKAAGEREFAARLTEFRRLVKRVNVPGFFRSELGISMGGTIAHNVTIEEAVANADKLMYVAKRTKNTIVTDTEILSDDASDKAITVLIADDSAFNRELLVHVLGENFEILEASDGNEAIGILDRRGKEINVVLLDLIMPKPDGYDVLEYMNDKGLSEDVPVIVITGDESSESVRRAYDMNVADYIRRPFDANVVYRKIFNVIRTNIRQRRLVSMVTDQVFEREKNNRMMISILSQIVEFRNGESGMHVVHMYNLSGLLIDKLMEKTDRYGLEKRDRFLISTASALHDIGKICIDEKILNKPGRLTPEEFDIMKTHTIIGESILRKLGIYQGEKLIAYACRICRSHHERWDGKGYPDGLKGDEIPISAQIVSIADVYDALVSKRVYKDAYDHDTAVKMIMGGECGAFNPLLLECFAEIADEIAGGGRFLSDSD